MTERGRGVAVGTAAARWSGGRPAVRVIVATAVLLVAFVLAVAWGPGWPFGAQPMWSVTALAALVAAAGAGVTFVPRPGEARLVHVGCGPCVLVDALAAVAGAWLTLTSAYDAGTAALGLALAGFALARRVTAPQVCDRPLTSADVR